jgi:Rrf2 family iron-sulfur cluster assembly transcriptional regulator
MMLDMAQHRDKGPVRIGDISRRQGISAKYLEQLIIPLKKAHYIKSIRGPKGGHMLAKSPEKITFGEIVNILEGGIDLCDCIENPDSCDRFADCLTHPIWKQATRAMCDELNAVTLADMLERREAPGETR